MQDMIKQDWKDMISAFYFPKLSKMITNDKLRAFIDKTNQELLEEGQEVS